MGGCPAGVLQGMKKLTIPAAIASLALVLSACGGSANSNSAPSTPASSGVLVDSAGLTLYTPDGESASNVRCTGTCAAVWKPLRPGAATLTGAKVITRPDGTKQLALAGKPLYTFVQDSPGSLKGNGASDTFGAKRFSWHAIKKGGAAAASAPMPRGYGY
jgi:predicted lipoprotein with Yx(FWY)xxD motif